VTHFQPFEEKESKKDFNTNGASSKPIFVDCNGITELQLENWESINLLTLRPIALFLGANLMAVSFAKCFNLTDEMMNMFTADTANSQKLDLSECLQLTDLSIRFAVQCCGSTLQGINISKCTLLTNDSCRWLLIRRNKPHLDFSILPAVNTSSIYTYLDAARLMATAYAMLGGVAVVTCLI
jgi:hypothetical protein